jgi:lipoprotein-anchoring transpeptidase ErfK/SrfK
VFSWKSVLTGLLIATSAAVYGAQESATTQEPATTLDDQDGQPDIEIWLSEGVGRYGNKEFGVSGGRPEFPSPTGAFEIEWKSRLWWSKQWQAPMPYAMFFHNGAAIHVGSLDSHSHGCIRVSEDTAKWLFRVTREKETRVFVYP